MSWEVEEKRGTSWEVVVEERHELEEEERRKLEEEEERRKLEEEEERRKVEEEEERRKLVGGGREAGAGIGGRRRRSPSW